MIVWLSNAVVRSIADQAEEWHALETGGALLGWRKPGQAIVMGLIGPGPGAVHQARSFYPDHEWQVARLAEAFSATDGDLDYLGDWHSHPDGHAMMSSEDRRTLVRCSALVPMLTVIAARGPCRLALGCWTPRHDRRWWQFGNAAVTACEIRRFDPPSSWPERFLLDRIAQNLSPTMA